MFSYNANRENISFECREQWGEHPMNWNHRNSGTQPQGVAGDRKGNQAHQRTGKATSGFNQFQQVGVELVFRCVHPPVQGARTDL
jgi:hypothetical protein